ncbi:hypothetical protein [Actinomadura latina]|uniref:Serine/threonine protein kinase n=1 Tax=Actinomadura latina TaxID=163603 RepID=A0A846ZEK2_9ACTN|nr:hypothetical protein [Actinomadura latina]NKZ08446.1 hypothetical protein [Actinomadura latina]
MSRPLPPGDPAQLGPFRLSARLSESAAGIVFLGVDGAGRRASVAVLNRGAAGDAAARDRFRAAINAAVPAAGGVPGRGSLAEPGGAAPVVAAQPDGPAPWVATLYEADRVGAERFLEPVVFQGAERAWWGGRRRGPQFQPYWLGSGEPALEGPPRPAPAPGAAPVGEQPPERSLVAAIVGLAAALLVLALLMGVLFACQPVVKEPPPPPPEPTPSFPQPSQSPRGSSPSPSPSGVPTTPAPSPSPSGSPSGSGGGDDGAPL